jgi:hypothetical protein
MRTNPYQRDIMEHLCCSAEEAQIVEGIMRESIFHSTLDWLPAEQFQDGARKAWRLFLSEREFFESHHREIKAMFLELKGAEAQ